MARPSRWLVDRERIERTIDSRQFVDDILGHLASANFGLAAWATFFARSLVRSAKQARLRPLAAAEITAIHLIAAATGRRRWVAFSWLVCITHLGLLGDSSTLGWPNRLTLLRALLPALGPASRRTSLVALATDFADGRIARSGAATPFGAFADPIADGVFWSWYALRWERSRWLRWAPLIVFTAALTGISAAYFVSARTIDYPRSIAIRNASVLAQLALTLRNLRAVAR